MIPAVLWHDRVGEAKGAAEKLFARNATGSLSRLDAMCGVEMWVGHARSELLSVRIRRLVPTDSQHCYWGFTPHITIPTHTDIPHDIHSHNTFSLSPFLSLPPRIPSHSSLSSVHPDPVSQGRVTGYQGVHSTHTHKYVRTNPVSADPECDIRRDRISPDRTHSI